MDWGLLSLKNSDFSHKDFPKYSVLNLQFFSRNFLSLSLITAIGKYIYWQNYKLSRALS